MRGGGRREGWRRVGTETKGGRGGMGRLEGEDYRVREKRERKDGRSEGIVKV